MNTFTACAVSMPALWQVAIGIVIVLIALYGMRQNSFGYIASVVVMGFGLPAFIHDYTFMGGTILLSVLIALITHWSHRKS